ncbi:hypothetical protein FisN_24Hu260 [Fistulifera solaris]|uniref:FAD dependent oxidoreductase domain-containing protein n=1 Tax=Fistulifera solaris TaxID=1519565 RepID=A0A1Z5K2K1_FISSO|nr:hypothetical protein FisN_24Hu260 [Fistulifera solaris]|eukprot:GAX20490.1 hypothetical protein FisN_24Hu260 [Fistulifera solaris]
MRGMRIVSRRRMSHQATTIHPHLSDAPITVIGGGMAGLAVTYHLLSQGRPPHSIQVFDKAPVGQGGASAVAGGLLHPLSPRGKLVYKGLEGLYETNLLLQTTASAVVKDRLVRVATTESQARMLQTTAQTIPHICEWIAADEMQRICPSEYGGLMLQNGCKVVDVPAYLKGLWNACEQLAQETNCQLTWTVTEHAAIDEDDIIVYTAGSGLFQSNLLSASTFPMQLVHGQSLVLRNNNFQDALLCGKYISPLNDHSRLLVGSTHEFRDDLLSPEQVIQELKERTSAVAPHLWEDPVVEKITKGTRVQSERGTHGRLPIVGKLPGTKQHWVLTGLSSRGLLYHALYGKMLAKAILQGSEDCLNELDDGILWWKKKLEQLSR